MDEKTKDMLKQIYNEGYSNAIEDVQKILHDVGQALTEAIIRVANEHKKLMINTLKG